MKVLHVLFLIALISCEQFNFEKPIFINDANESNDANDVVSYKLCGTNEFLEIVSFSPQQLKSSEHVDAKVTFKANKNVNIKKMEATGKLLVFGDTLYFDINKNLNKGDEFTFEYNEQSIPWFIKGTASLILKLYDVNGNEVFCAEFRCPIENIFQGQLTYTSCGSADYLEISDYSPKEINPGDSIVAKITVKAKQALEATKIHYDVQYIGITLLSGDVDISVSLAAGESYSQEQAADVPQVIPPGQYNIIAKAYDSAGTELYCANFQIIF